jgi:(1->4)-alpha-D-glucan 1-alpha-D-glucosylmutase
MDLRGTYRLQLSPDADFAFARSLVPYLRSLGVSHLYLSPSLRARSGSTHGYDVVDPTQVSEALGGEEGLRALAGEGLGIVLDIVPNHMGTGDENRWWSDPAERSRVFDVDPETGFYRRFFDIDDLAAVRAEREDVFSLTHAKVLELIAEGVLDGVRVDHPDGLADPAGYLRRLRKAGAKRVWVEKILHPGELLRDWPVDGTVGYEFLVDATSLFVDGSAEEPLTSLYGEVTGERRPFEDVALEAQREQASGTFSREVEWLERLAPGIDGIADALALLPVYRTYVEPWSGRLDRLDREAVAGLPERLRRILLLEERGFDEFVTRFQQTSPPVTAKGIEDTAFYRYNRLVCLNEVGNDPGRFGLSVADFHEANLRRPPDGLLITSTHDTKRSADVRARIGAIASHLPEWRTLIGAIAPGFPDPNEAWMVLQNVVGAWPISADRVEGFVEKALREAKVNSTWADPQVDYESRVERAAVDLLSSPDVARFVDLVRAEGDRVALAQVALKMTVPGVPDVYGGDEEEYRALVDPDNRRPIDWDALRSSPDGPKRALIRAALQLRARRPEAFAGPYVPLEAPDGVCAFARGEDEEVLVAVPTRPGPSFDPPPGYSEIFREGSLLILERR